MSCISFDDFIKLIKLSGKAYNISETSINYHGSILDFWKEFPHDKYNDYYQNLFKDNNYENNSQIKLTSYDNSINFLIFFDLEISNNDYLTFVFSSIEDLVYN